MSAGFPSMTCQPVANKFGHLLLHMGKAISKNSMLEKQSFQVGNQFFITVSFKDM